MKSKQILGAFSPLLVIVVLLVLAGTCHAGKLEGPYRLLSQDGSVVFGVIDSHMFKLQDGVTTDLGSFGGKYIYPAAVSADGSAVVGRADPVGSGYHAFRWSNGTMTDLGTLGGTYSDAYAISADGSVVVGGANVDNNLYYHAFRWVDNNMTDLGTLGGGYSEAVAVSADGSVVVGEAQTTDNGPNHAFRWVNNTMTDLETLGGTYSAAVAVSADGSVVVGTAFNADENGHAFRWVNNTMTDLETLGGTYSAAVAVSADGSVVVGDAFLSGNSSRHAFRWVDNTMTDLGALGGDNSEVYAMSADGSVVVGKADTLVGQSAFRWDETTGTISVTEWLEDEDVTLAGWDLRNVKDVSADGSVLIGDGYNPDGDYASWMARKGVLIDPVQWMSTVSGARQVFHTGAQLSSLSLTGAHHRPLMSYDQTGKGLGFWATGDLGIFTEDLDIVSDSAEIGMYNDYADGRLRAGLGFGYSGQRQDLPFSGSTDLDGGYLVGEINWRVGPADRLIASVTATYGLWDAEVTRGYLNGSDEDRSTGDTNVQSAAIRMKLDWQDAGQIGPVRFDPYAGLTFSQTRVDSYTEANGSVPAQFDTQKQNAQELRAGVASVMSPSSSTQLRLTLEGVYRFDNNGPALSGQDVGGFNIAFDIPGDKIQRTWVRVGAEVDYTINDSSMVALSLNGATQGQDPDVSGAVSYRMRF